jgi:hypothetical protein
VWPVHADDGLGDVVARREVEDLLERDIAGVADEDRPVGCLDLLRQPLAALPFTG